MKEKSIKDNNISVLKLLTQLYYLISEKRKIQLLFLVLLMLFSAIAEMTTIVSLIPFLTVLTNSEKLWSSEMFIKYASNFGINNNEELLLPLIIIFLTLIILSGVVRLLNLWLGNYLSSIIGSDLSYSSFGNVLNQNYEFHIYKNSSETIARTAIFVEETIVSINLALQFLTALIVIFLILIVLLFVNWSVALSSFSIFGLAYISISILSKRKVLNNSKIIANFREIQIRLIYESLGSIKDLILDKSHAIYLKNFKKIDLPIWIKKAENNYIGLFPKYCFEVIGICALILLAYNKINTSKSDDYSSIITIIGTFAFAAQRLLPNLQLCYSSWNGIRNRASGIQEVLSILKMKVSDKKIFNKVNKFNLKSGIVFKNINFNYPSSDKTIISNLNLNINKGEILGIIGTTGCGKSTIIDLLMGLLKPSSGQIFIDEVDLYSNESLIDSWRSSISHVPQNIYLTDASIKKNIILSDSEDNINLDRLMKAAEQAQILEFIETLKYGLNTKIGERGVQLSGGQRQRIGIARALYKNNDILILDEATSALDNKTEDKIISSLINNNKKKTLIMIAHRLSTLQKCDRIISIENGKIIKEEVPKK